jgi:hypothetical protein
MTLRKICMPMKCLKLFIFLLVLISIVLMVLNQFNLHKFSPVVSNFTLFIDNTPVINETSVAFDKNAVDLIKSEIDEPNANTTNHNLSGMMKCANFSDEFNRSNLTSNFYNLFKNQL